MASPARSSPSLFVSDDGPDRSSQRSCHESFSNGQADIESPKYPHSPRPVTPRKRLRDSTPSHFVSPSATEYLSNETADMSPNIWAPWALSTPVPQEGTRSLEGGTMGTRLASFTDIERAYMFAGAREFVAKAEAYQQAIADEKSSELDRLENLIDQHEQFCTKAWTASREFPKSHYWPRIDDYLRDDHERPSVAIARAACVKVENRSEEVERSLDALIEALKDASQATEKLKIDHAAAWDEARADAAREVEKHRVNLQMLEQGIWDSS